MIAWLKHAFTHISTSTNRIRLYVVAIALVTASVPFFHIDMGDRLSLTEAFIHILSVTLSTTIAIILFELLALIYLKNFIENRHVSTVFLWLSFAGVFILSLAIMHATHDFFPITFEIWNKHIKPDLVATPWKALPIALIIGYILIQLIRRHEMTQELADLKKLNEKLQTAVRNSIQPSNNDAKESRYHDVSTLALPLNHKENLYLNPASIIRVESNENYCHFWLAPNEEQSAHRHMARITLAEVANQLPENSFLQVHRSHIVNFRYVENLLRQKRNYQLQLTNGDNIPVSRSRIKQIRQKVQETCL